MKFRAILAALRRWSWPGLFGLVFLLLACGATLTSRAMEERTLSTQAHVTVLENRLKQELAPQTTPSASSQEEWLAQLPPATTRQQRLADLLEISIHQGLNITRTEHRLSSDAATGLERVRVSMPLQGSYAQIRSFIGAALQHDPALSLDSLKLRRANLQSSVVDAELVWSLHSRRAGGSA
jgi:Tfp pilus assembly protein PilO